MRSNRRFGTPGESRVPRAGCSWSLCDPGGVTAGARACFVRLPLRSAGRHRTEAHDERLDLIAALGELTERQRAIVVARYALGLSQLETAESFGVSAGTIAATCHHAITRLRRRLEGLE